MSAIFEVGCAEAENIHKQLCSLEENLKNFNGSDEKELSRCVEQYKTLRKECEFLCAGTRSLDNTYNLTRRLHDILNTLVKYAFI